jgi:protein-tyrosine phosphatase
MSRWLGRRERVPLVDGDGLVLFVCHGNIMRSALAEAALRRELGRDSQIRVASAGTAAVPGKKADPRTITYARAAGLDLDSHWATLLDRSLAEQAALLLALDRRIEAEILALGDGLSGRTVLLGGMTEDSDYPGRDIPDPYSLPPDEGNRSFDRVLESVAALARRLGAKAAARP